MTWHGTVVCRPDPAGTLRHYPILLPRGAAPMLIDPAALQPGSITDHPDLGRVQALPGHYGRAIHLQRQGFYMCAERNGLMVFDRQQADGWERFLPIGTHDLAVLQQMLGRRWIMSDTRQLIRRRDITLHEGYVLHFGPFVLNLASLSAPIRLAREGTGQALRLRLQHAHGFDELVSAEPGGSLLLHTTGHSGPGQGGSTQVATPRALAEIVTAALHRHLTGTEPQQLVFDQHAAFLEARGVAAGLEDLLELLVPQAADGPPRVPPRAPAQAANPHVPLSEAVTRFGKDNPAPESDKGGAPDGPALLAAANQSLRRFLAETGVARAYTFATFDRGSVAPDPHDATLLADIDQGAVTLGLRQDVPPSWMLMQRCLPLIQVLEASFARGAPQAARFLIEPGDGGIMQSVAYCSKVRTSCLVPDYDFITGGAYAQMRALAAERRLPWAARAQKIFWRGSTTGRRCKPPPADGEEDDFTWLPRLDLCRRAQVSPLAAFYDVGVSTIAQIPEPALEKRIRQSGLVRPRVPREAFLGHKALVVIDGNANAWSALFCALLSGACVLLVTSQDGYRQWYYDRLEPWQHYVPVSKDLKDLDRVAQWVLDNDDDARAIGEAGQAFAESLGFDSEIAGAGHRLSTWLRTARI